MATRLLDEVDKIELEDKIGGGGGGAGAFIINVTGDETAGYSIDKTGDEIKEAYNAGMLLSCKRGNTIIPLVYCKPSAVVNGPDEWLFAAITETATSTKVAINVRRVPNSRITTTVTATNYVVASGTDTDPDTFLLVALAGNLSDGYTISSSEMTYSSIWTAIMAGANVMCILEIMGVVVGLSFSGMVDSGMVFTATAELQGQAGSVIVTISDTNSVSVELIPLNAGGSGSSSAYLVLIEGDDENGYRIAGAVKGGTAEPISCTKADIDGWLFNGDTVLCTYGTMAMSLMAVDMETMQLLFGTTAVADGVIMSYGISLGDDGAVDVQMNQHELGSGSSDVSGASGSYVVMLEEDNGNYQVAGAMEDMLTPTAYDYETMTRKIKSGANVACGLDGTLYNIQSISADGEAVQFGVTLTAEGIVAGTIIILYSDGTVEVVTDTSAPMVVAITDAGDGTFVLCDIEHNPIEDPYGFFTSDPLRSLGAVALDADKGRIYRPSTNDVETGALVLTCNDGTAQHRYIIHADNTITYDVITSGSEAETEMVLSDNLFDKSTAIKGKVFYHSSSGMSQVNADYSYYQYVPLRGSGTYRTKWDNSQHASTGARISILNSWLMAVTGTLTETGDNYAYDFEFVVTQDMINNGAAKIAFDCHTNHLDTVMIVKDIPYPDEYIPYGYIEVATDTGKKQDNILAGKTAVFLGDSICAGTTVTGEYYNYGWAGLIGEPNRMNWTNYGMNGGTVTSLSDVQNTRWLTTQADKALAEHPAAHYVIFEGGCNDADKMKDDLLGTISSDYATFDTTTFSGAFEALVLKLVTSFPAAKIGYIIPQKMYAQNDHTATGHVHRRYFDRAIEICEKWGIPYVDLWKGNPLNPKLSTASTFYTDGQHLTLAGYQRITPQIEAFMRSL